MHKQLEKIKLNEGKPKVLKNVFNSKHIEQFIKLYNELPITVHNKKQNVIKKRWLIDFGKELEELFYNKLKNEIGNFKYDNLKTENGDDILGLFQESYNPIGLHIDGGFNFEDLIYKQSLVPLTPVGSTVIFKNRFYGESTNFTIDKNELDKKELKYGQNKRSSEHLNMFKKKPFDEKLHKKFLNHEDINNLNGLEVELVYEWELGSMLIFDRTNLHCSSSVISGKKLGLTTFTKK
ncbi:hypothetical protein OAR89_04155 [Pelagibacteraceae bacterium]|jgi:hypothetical protein|nr:hypothetical protein [Pelagibacteraceae bacterium]MDC0530449.1 hypothetical protein [Pelagibacteraceae bacterium]MDC0952935.1 hypothetical protein [Pelagibacteraceae bacterium]